MSLDNLPVGWMKVSLGECLDIVRGASPRPKGDPKYFGGDIAWISIKDINAEKGRYLTTTRETVTQLGAEKSRLLEEGSLILSNSGSVCIPKILKIQGCIHDGFVTFPNLNKYFSADYFYHYFNYIRPAVIEANKQGVTQVNLNTEIVKGLDVILPSTPEQQEIVRQLDVMLAQVEQIKARLDAIPAILKKFRQSVLADAVSGKLLDGAVESSIYSVKDIFEITSGIAFKKSEYTEDGYKLLQIANVSHGKTKWETLNFVSEQNAKQFDNCVLKSGDVVIALNRPITHDLLKIAKITEQDLPAILYQRVACLRIKDKELVDSEFLFLSMQTMSFRKVIEAKLRGSDQPYLNTSDLGNLTINLIPLNEQKQTLEKIGVLLSKSNQIEAVVQLAQKRVNLFTQSILAKAFSGELTTEWREQHQELITGINSAESLLAKIQEEREASKPAKKTRKKKKV